jgi:hypothetical protein
MPTITVPFTECDDSPQEQWTDKGFQATVKLKCAWNDRDTLASELLQQGGTYYFRNNWTSARARSIAITAFGVGDPPTITGPEGPKWMNPDSAILTVQYVDDENTAQGTEVLVESLEPTCELLHVPGQFLHWQVGGNMVDPEVGVALRQYKMVYSVARKGIPYIPSAVLALLGCCNSVPVQASRLGVTFAAETLLYNSPQCSRRFTTSGTEGWDMAFKWPYQPQGWNQFWNPQKMAWDKMLLANGSWYKPFPPGDLRLVMS